MITDFKLLYVEDNEEVRNNFVEIFGRYFKEIITAEDGESALEIYKDNHFDIAILDISIPKINGLNVAKKIRETNDDIEIIMLTAYSDTEKLLKAINLRLFSYLIKPVKFTKLDKNLKEVITKLYGNSIINFTHGYTYNTSIKKLYYEKEEIKISKNENKLIEFLLTDSNRHYTPCEIAANILANNKDDIKCNNITQLISRFKKKMLNLYNKEYFFIDNIYGMGYKINL